MEGAVNLRSFFSSTFTSAHPGRTSYAQSGEDLIIDYALTAAGIAGRSYLDVGSGDPVQLSNTFLFYQMGYRGVLVEPDPQVCDKARRVRPGDRVLNIGIGAHASTGRNFYMMNPPTLSTFSKEEAERYQSVGHTLNELIRVNVKTINSVLIEEFAFVPEIISIDVEGLELEILQALDVGRYRPYLFCVETLEYSPDGLGRKKTEINDLLGSEDYLLWADTYINSIFVDRRRWESHGR